MTASVSMLTAQQWAWFGARSSERQNIRVITILNSHRMTSHPQNNSITNSSTACAEQLFFQRRVSDGHRQNLGSDKSECAMFKSVQRLALHGNSNASAHLQCEVFFGRAVTKPKAHKTSTDSLLERGLTAAGKCKGKGKEECRRQEREEKGKEGCSWREYDRGEEEAEG